MKHGYCKNCFWFNNFDYAETDDIIKFLNVVDYCGMWHNCTRPDSWCPDYNRKKILKLKI